MNGYEKLEEKYLNIIRTSLNEFKAVKRDKMACGIINDEKEIEITERRIRRMDEIIECIDKTLKTKDTRNKRNNSNFEALSNEDIFDLMVFLNALRLNYENKIEKLNAVPDHDAAKKLTNKKKRINEVFERLTGAKNRKKKKAHIGEVGLASDGKTEIRIVHWMNENNIDVQFPDGRIITKQVYYKFKNGKIETHEDYVRRKYG